jgi:hypothetical protein
MLKTLRIETGLSKNSDGTWNGHITLHWPDREKEAYYYPGDPGKPFRTDREASEWCQAEVRNLVGLMKANEAMKAPRLKLMGV